MKVEIKFYGGMENFIVKTGPDSGKKMEAEVIKGSTVRMLLRQLGIAEGEVFFLLNNVFQDLETALAEGDQIYIFPAIFGG